MASQTKAPRRPDCVLQPGRLRVFTCKGQDLARHENPFSKIHFPQGTTARFRPTRWAKEQRPDGFKTVPRKEGSPCQNRIDPCKHAGAALTSSALGTARRPSLQVGRDDPPAAILHADGWGTGPPQALPQGCCGGGLAVARKPLSPNFTPRTQARLCGRGGAAPSTIRPQGATAARWRRFRARERG